MVGDPEGKSAAGIRLRFEPFVEEDGNLPRSAQSTDDAQLTRSDHRLINDDIRHGRHAAGDQDGSG
ncbi:hypothetical protein AB4097_16140 [Microvirga sp. 2MCAF35]|uniref:hypothetical protein n=1 Tax=Microvirga sp. 2MCAF35 TaxID=3232987 RepID=UPI003F9D3AB7